MDIVKSTREIRFYGLRVKKKVVVLGPQELNVPHLFTSQIVRIKQLIVNANDGFSLIYTGYNLSDLSS